MTEALIDTTALSYFADLNAAMARAGHTRFDVFNMIALLVKQLHVPAQMQAEFARVAHLPEHGLVLHRIESRSSPFKLCLHSERITAAFLSSERIPGIDVGESDAIAQSQEIGVRFFITDDDKCTRAIEKTFPQLRCVSSLFILAALDLLGYMSHRDLVFGKYIRNYQSSKDVTQSTLLRDAYRRAASHYSINVSKAMLNTKGSIKRLPH